MKITRKVMTLPLISSVIFENNITFAHAANAEDRALDPMQETISDLEKGYILRFKSGSHIAMITSFDGTTYRYSGHTNDRLNTVINLTSSTAYYYRVG